MKLKCQICKNEWESRTENPLTCPKCRSRRWKEKEHNKISIDFTMNSSIILSILLHLQNKRKTQKIIANIYGTLLNKSKEQSNLNKEILILKKSNIINDFYKINDKYLLYFYLNFLKKEYELKINKEIKISKQQEYTSINEIKKTLYEIKQNYSPFDEFKKVTIKFRDIICKDIKEIIKNQINNIKNKYVLKQNRSLQEIFKEVSLAFYRELSQIKSIDYTDFHSYMYNKGIKPIHKKDDIFYEDNPYEEEALTIEILSNLKKIIEEVYITNIKVKTLSKFIEKLN